MLMIIFVHCINEYDILSSSISTYFMIPSYGTLGCSVFFFLSGYGMYHSVSKQREIAYPYLWSHLWKMLKPYLFSFALSIICIHIFCKTVSPNIWSILTISMPDGIDLWFFKTVLANYILIFFIFRFRYCMQKKLILLTGIHLVYIVTCYLTKQPGYIYFSNLAFPAGILVAYNDRISIWRKHIITITTILFIIFYVFKSFVHDYTILEITGNLSFAIAFTLVLTKYSCKQSTILVFLGKQSLLIYLLGIPVMQSIDSSSMSLFSYFAANVIITVALVHVYLFVTKRINFTKQIG